MSNRVWEFTWSSWPLGCRPWRRCRRSWSRGRRSWGGSSSRPPGSCRSTSAWRDGSTSPGRSRYGSTSWRLESEIGAGSSEVISWLQVWIVTISSHSVGQIFGYRKKTYFALLRRASQNHLGITGNNLIDTRRLLTYLSDKSNISFEMGRACGFTFLGRSNVFWGKFREITTGVFRHSLHSFGRRQMICWPFLFSPLYTQNTLE